MSFLYKKDKLTPPEWKLQEDGQIKLFRDEKDEIPVTYDEWKYTDPDDGLKLFKDY